MTDASPITLKIAASRLRLLQAISPPPLPPHRPPSRGVDSH